MTKLSEFEARVTSPKTPDHIRDAAIELADTLKICRAATEDIFGTKATPEHAIALLPMFMARADEKHRQLLARFGRSTDDV